MLSKAFLLLLGVVLTTSHGKEIPRKSPKYGAAFQQPLTIPTLKKPLATYTNPESGVPIDYYELEVKEFEKQFYPNLKKAKGVGYDGSFPGPTFRIERGRETVVRVINKSKVKMNLHLHGSYSRSPWDGWANDIIKTGEYKDYYYPNAINGRTLWYHDHAHGQSATNSYKGLFGMYQIVDAKVDASIGIPSGSKYDIPLMLSSHYFTADGDFTNESKETSSIYGDTWLVNGQIQPFLEVEPRKYRFRLLNSAVSRTLNLTIEDNKSSIALAIIGSDGGFREMPASTNSLIAGMAERWEFVVDFSSLAGKNLLVRATNMWTDTSFVDSDKIMQIRVSSTRPSQKMVKSMASRELELTEKDSFTLPQRFTGVDTQFPTERIAATREFKLVSHMDMMWGINSYHMDDPMKRVLMRPPLGTIEKYVFRSSGMGMGMGMNMGGSSTNKGKDNPGMSMGKESSGMSHMGGKGGMGNAGGMSDMGSMGSMGGMHGQSSSQGHSSHHGGMMKLKRLIKSRLNLPFSNSIKEKRQMGGMGGMGMTGNSYYTHAMHLHLVDMKIISRRKEDPKKPEGRDYLEAYEKDSVKDVVLLGSNEVIEVLAKFQPYPGVYMWHCHNTVHEDKGMMAVMNVTRLADFNYNSLDMRLEDPLDLRFIPQKFTSTNLEQIKTKVLPGFAKLRAYPDPLKLAELEAKYWTTKSLPGAKESGEKVIPNVDPEKLEAHNQHHGTGTSMPKATASASGAAHGSHHGRSIHELPRRSSR